MLHEAEKTLLTALKEIAEKGPQHKDDGICRNVSALVEEHEEFFGATAHMERLFREWPDNARAATPDNWVAEVYPVEGSAAKYTFSQVEGTLWQNPRRIALLDWMIKELERDKEVVL